MRDVAKRANVSVNTVSLALNNSSRVHPDTKARVLQAVQELGYTPHYAAQQLRRGVSKTIGILIPDLHNFHFWDVVEGVEDEAYRRGFGVVLTNTRLDPNREYAMVRELMASRYDGIILARASSQQPPHDVESVMRNGSFIITLGRTWPGVDGIVYVSEEVRWLLLEHLYRLGHRRIGFVTSVASEGPAIERVNTYTRFITERRLPSMIAPCGPTIPDSIEATKRLLSLDPRPTAIMCVNDYLALGVYRAILERGLRIPEDISVTGFDNTRVGAHLFPALTTVDIGGQRVGREAVRLLVERIADRNAPQQIVEIEAALIERESTAPPPE